LSVLLEDTLIDKQAGAVLTDSSTIATVAAFVQAGVL
jgi:hypothetical protein